MADDRSKPLYVDPQILVRDLGDSLSAAGRATTSPDDESQLREASRRLGIPLDTARANPAETKRAVEQDSFDASDYASRFPSSAKYLADQQNALIAKDDVQPLSEVEKTLRRQVAENMAGGPITDGTSAGRRALPTLTSDREEEQQVLRTEGFAAASRLQRTNASRREAEQYAGSMTATPPSEVRKFFDSLGRGIGSTTDAAVSGLQYSDVGIAGAFQSLFDTIAPVMDPLAGTVLPENPLRRVAAGLADYRQKGTNSADARMPKGDTNLSAGYYSGISSLSRNLVALPLALVPGGQGAALSMMTAPVYGQEYGKAKDKGKSTSTAIAYGGTQALIEYATEKLPLSRLIGDIKQGTPFFKLLARQMALEVPGEQLATVLQDLNEWAVLNPEKSFQDYVEARPAAAMQTLVATVVGTGGQVSIISGLQVAADKIAGREARAQREQDRATSGAEQLEQLMAAAAASMTRVRDPQSFSQLVQEAAEDSGTAPTELFIDARRLVEILPQEMLAQLPSVQEQLGEALATDGAVVIPIGEATTTLAGTGFEQELVRNARVTEDAWTAAEAEEGRDLVAQLEQEALQVTEEQTQAQAWEESSKQVFDTLMGELTTAARFAPDVNRAYATLVRNFYTVQAARTGTTPQELYERYPLTVSSRGPGVTDNTLDQEGPSVIPSEKPGAVRVRGVHYSAARRPTLDGRYFGTGLKGAERARIQSLPGDSPLRSRVLAYVDEGSGIRPEQGVGSVAHTVDLDNIYDTEADPLGIWQGNPDANAREQAVLDAGYDGFYAPASMNMGGNKDMGVVALLGEAAYEVPTRPYGGERAQAAAKPQASEMRQALEDFRDHPDLQYGAPSPRMWGVFTKLKAPELYEKLAPTGIFEGEENLYKSDLIARVQGQGVFAQNVATPEGEVDDQGTREAGNRGGRYSSGNLAPLEGAPTVAGAAGPDPRLVSVAEQYARDNGIDLRRQAEFAEVDPERAARIAQAYAEMRHAPNDPKVKEAYDDLIRQTRAQYDALVAAGYQFTLFDEGSDPYGGNPWNAMRDLRANQRMAVYATEAGFGVGAQVNIGLADPQGGAGLNPAQVIEALRAVGAEVEVSSVYSSDTEPTLVAKLKQALTKEQGDRVSEMLGQEAIAQRTDDEQGQLFGPMAEQWGPYNPAYFVTTTGDRADAIANPLLQDTGLQWPNQNGEMRPVLANDLFRAVHDAFGHGLEGAGFRARGEENAWQAHARLFTGPAVGAITTETRGQNSWLNYGPYGEQNQNAAVEDTVFAEQKTGLMPEWVWAEGRVGDEQAAQGEVFNQSPIDASLDEVLRLTPDEYLDLVNPTGERSDEDGSAKLVRGDLTDPQNATVLRELDGGVTIERDAEGNVYARQGGDTIGEIINYGDEVNANVLPEARGAGVATEMVAEFIRANPVFNAGSLTAGGEAAVRAAFRQLQAEQVLSQSVPQTETEAFKRWSGDSKVVDAEGKPLVVYHGTGGDFAEFDPERSGSKSKTGAPESTFFFTDAADVANSYTVEYQGDFSTKYVADANVVPAYLSIKKPLKVSAKGESWRDIVYKGEFYDINELAKLAQESGKYDGLIVTQVKDKGRGDVTSKTATTYVAFRPEQIKSAIGNNGNFDPADPNILNQSSRKTPETLYIDSMIGDGTSKVLKNPTRNQALAFAKQAKYESLRGIVDPATGDLYLADSHAVDHRMLAEGVGLVWEDVRYSTDPETGSSNRLSIPAKAVEFYPRQIFSDDGALNQATGARATFNPATLDIALLQKADLSSFLHETGHFFFEMQAILASQPDAPQALVDDMQVLLNHVGFTGTAAEWMAQSVSARREAHETVAESFEQYLFTGKAPTAELQPLFHRFRSWMISVYRSLQQFLATNKRAGLNPDIAAVFDRMLASEKAINDALAVRQFAPMFGSAADAGMTDEAFAAYQEDIDRQQADALDAVQARTLRDLKWLDNARGRKLKELQKEAAAQRKAVRDEVTAEVNAQPVYRAMEFLKYGRVESDGEQIQVEVTKAAKLNITEVQAMYPEGELGTGADWRSLGYGKYGMLSDAGLHPDTVAEMFGFRSGRQLVTALLEAESKADLINGLTDQRMLERYGDIASPQAMQEAANEALANEARARLVATELAALTKATGKPGLIARAARQAAEQMVAAKPVRNLRPDLAAASAARARKAAEAAMAKGDTASAAAAKRTEILQIQLERVQRKAQQDHDKALRDFKKIFKGTNEKIAKSRDIGMVSAARGVLARYGLAPKTSAANAQAYAELLANYDGAMSADINSILQGLPLPADFRDLTVEQFRGVRDVVNGLYYLARRSRQVEIDGQKLEIDAVADELVAATTARAGGVVPPLPGYAGTPTERDKWMAGLHSAKAALTRVEFWSDNMGPAFKKYIWNPVAEATTRMRTQRTELIRQYRDLLQGIEKGITYNKIDAPELGAVGFTFNAGKSELLHAILHTGNKSNLTKLLLGRGWGTLDANGALDTQRWDQFVTRMITEGVLTKADFDFAQGVWDLLETVKKDAQAAHKEMYGYYFNEVTADAIDTPFGQYRGGYVPALADSLSSPEMAQKREQEDLLHAGNSFMFPTTGKGFTQSRVFFNRPLELDLRTIGSHLDKVARFAYLEPTVRDVNQLISNKRVARALNGANPGAIGDMLTPWLQRTARQSTSMPGKNPKVNRFFNGLRSRTGMVFMFGNVVNTLQQLTGFSLAALRVPAPKLLRATARYMGNPSSMREEVATKSPWLANRMDSQSYAMQDQIDEILTNPGAYEKTVEFAKRHAYFLQQAMQNVMDPIVWTGAYDHALSKGVTEKEAIRYADEAVRTTQGSFAPEDVAGFEVQSPFVRLFTQFYGYFNMWGNLLGNEANKAVREMGYTKARPRLLFIWFAGVAIPSVVAEIIARGLPDDEDDEDGDGTLDEWLALFFGSQAKSLAATVPGVGHLAVLGANMLDSKVYNDRFNISPSLSAAESAVRGGASLLSGELLDEDVKKREVRDILTLIGLGTGLPVAPVSRAAGYAADVNSGAVEPEGAAGMAAGLLLGR